ncbi:MAG TPA: glycosyltransferase family 1 protein [candidate division Zixibacteria bacterium]|nr:glycosyltransferase family 1 protein [candidate division Zixibacteria bacterium]
MNILALNWQDISNPLAGGAEVHLEELLRRISARGHTVTLFCSGYSGAKPEEDIEGVHIIRRGNRYNFNLIAPFYLRKLVKGGNFDVLIEDINKIPFYTPLYLNIPTLVVIPHLFSTSVFKEINFLLGLYIYLSEMPLVSVYRGRKFNVISESTAEDMSQKGIPADDISVIHCGIDDSVYSYNDAIAKYDEPTILYLGRIKKYKSIDHLILAFERVRENIPEVRLYIVGSGDYLESLKKLAGKLKLDDKVYFAGYVSVAKKIEFLRKSHVAVYPSLKEGWGLTNIEANACGTSVIAADSPGLRDSVSDGETGFLYQYGNIDQLAEKLEKILTDKNVRTNLEEGGRRWARKFSWDDAADSFLDLLESIANENK